MGDRLHVFVCVCVCILDINLSGPQPYPVIYAVASPVLRGLLGRKSSEEHLRSFFSESIEKKREKKGKKREKKRKARED